MVFYMLLNDYACLSFGYTANITHPCKRVWLRCMQLQQSFVGHQIFWSHCGDGQVGDVLSHSWFSSSSLDAKRNGIVFDWLLSCITSEIAWHLCILIGCSCWWCFPQLSCLFALVLGVRGAPFLQGFVWFYCFACIDVKDTEFSFHCW